MQAKHGWSVSTSSTSLAALGDAEALRLERVGHPDVAVGVEADAVGRPRRRGRPTRAGSQRAVAAMSNAVSRGPQRLADDQRAAVGSDHRAVREVRSSAATLHRAVGVDAGQLGHRWSGSASASSPVSRHEVEAEVADVGAALASTTMSLQWQVASSDRSACSTSGRRARAAAACGRASTRRASAVGQPAEARGLVSAPRRPSRVAVEVDRFTAWSWKSENQSRPSCQRGPSPKYSPSANTLTSPTADPLSPAGRAPSSGRPSSPDAPASSAVPACASPRCASAP